MTSQCNNIRERQRHNTHMYISSSGEVTDTVAKQRTHTLRGISRQQKKNEKRKHRLCRPNRVD